MDTKQKYFRCTCCGASYHTSKPQNPAFDTGFGAGECCQERLAASYERHGFGRRETMPPSESAAMFSRYA